MVIHKELVQCLVCIYLSTSRILARARTSDTDEFVTKTNKSSLLIFAQSCSFSVEDWNDRNGWAFCSTCFFREDLVRWVYRLISRDMSILFLIIRTVRSATIYLNPFNLDRIFRDVYYAVLFIKFFIRLKVWFTQRINENKYIVYECSDQLLRSSVVAVRWWRQRGGDRLSDSISPRGRSKRSYEKVSSNFLRWV